jgi:hypothetical protein
MLAKPKAAAVLSMQRFCIQRGIPILPELHTVAVLKPTFESVHGNCIHGVTSPGPGP